MARRARADERAARDDATTDAAVEQAVEAAIAAASVAVSARGVSRGAARSHRLGRLIETLARWPGADAGRGRDRGHDPAAGDPVDRVLARALVGAVGDAWRRGWQPADLHRVVSREHGRAHARLVVRAIGREVQRHPDALIPPRWRLQLDAIGADEPWRGAGRARGSGDGRGSAADGSSANGSAGDGAAGGGSFRGGSSGDGSFGGSSNGRAAGDGSAGDGSFGGGSWRDGSSGRGEPAWAVTWPPALGPDGRPSAGRLQAVEVAVTTVALVRSLPVLPRLGPIPGDDEAAPRSRADRRVRAGADPRVLHKVTALLAKAESTNFPDEAEALTAKAQQLMTRHAIDQANLAADTASEPRVGGRRVGIDDPYAGARYLLLSLVADANRCRAVWTRQWGFSTVFGDEGDLDAVELLYTSLLVQATRAMVADPFERRARSGPSEGGRSRRGPRAGDTRSFRQSFLIAFAQRVGERLAEAADAVTADAATRSAALVPLFEARRAAAQAALDEAFPDVRTTRMSARNAAGWHAGVRAADQAELDAYRRVPRRAVHALR